MKNTDASFPEWKLIGEMELSLSAQAESVISAWLGNVLEPLELPAEFRTRVLRSTGATVAHAISSNGAALRAGHIHLLIFVTPDHKLKGNTWGFFHVEKVDGAGRDQNSPDHSIVFYLYAESQSER